MAPTTPSFLSSFWCPLRATQSPHLPMPRSTANLANEVSPSWLPFTISSRTLCYPLIHRFQSSSSLMLFLDSETALRCLLLCVGGRGGQRKCRPGRNAFLLLDRGTTRPAHCHFDGRQGRAALVQFLLLHGNVTSCRPAPPGLTTSCKIGASVLEFIGLSLTFWRKTGQVYRIEHPRENEATGGRTKEALKSKITWICSAFFFTYMGIEGKPFCILFQATCPKQTF